MSVKLRELVLKSHNGSLVIGKLNKRGHLNDYIDVSIPVINATIKHLTTQKDKTFIHQEIIDSETKEVKHYGIECYELTSEEILNLKKHKEECSKRAKKEFSSLMGLMLNCFGRIPLQLK